MEFGMKTIIWQEIYGYSTDNIYLGRKRKIAEVITKVKSKDHASQILKL